MRRNYFLTIIILISILGSTYAQLGEPTTRAPKNWPELDQEKDGIQGMSIEQTYKELLKGRKSQPVIVAVIDSGVDPDHEDLRTSMWTNKDEIAGNGKDDDKNGYIDDIHGWNFIGNANGQNVSKDTYEFTREYVRLKAKFPSGDNVKNKDKAEYEYYKTVRKAYESKKTEMEQQYKMYSDFKNSYLKAKKYFDKHFDSKEYTFEDVQAIKGNSPELNQAKGVMSFAQMNGVDEKELEKAEKHFDSMLNFALNEKFDPRNIVGDTYTNLKEKHYGNNDVEGEDAGHGTHVAGIIAADRNNDIGIKGVADNARIMSIRAVPDGDERDKDIANAIYYATNNGARIINMSFGKSYSPHKKAVDKAVKYAEKKGVLLIHAAGNSSENIDIEDNYPNKEYLGKSSSASNWIEVGASSPQKGLQLPGIFSNYGKKSVDVFAPGVQIYSTVPDNKYQTQDGTSMASPAVAGLAALLMSYFPQLDVQEVRKIILSSVVSFKDFDVNLPSMNQPKKVKFGELCNTGGVVNAYNAVKMAIEMEGKK